MGGGTDRMGEGTWSLVGLVILLTPKGIWIGQSWGIGGARVYKFGGGVYPGENYEVFPPPGT